MSAHPSLPPKITKKDLYAEANSTKGQIVYWSKTVVLLLISSLLVAIASYSFITPNGFTIGGVSGIAILINVATNGAVPQWTVLFGINLPLVITAFFTVKRKFAILSATNIGLQTIWLAVLESALPTLQVQFDTNGEKIFARLSQGFASVQLLRLLLKRAAARAVRIFSPL